MSQLIKKFVGDNQVADEKIRLDNDSYLRSRNAANNGDVNVIGVNSSDQRLLDSFGPSQTLQEVGTQSFPYERMYVNNIFQANGCGADFIDVFNGEINDQGGNVAINAFNRKIIDSNGFTAIDFISATEVIIEPTPNSSIQREVWLREASANGTNYVALRSPAALTANTLFQFPSDNGTAGYVLTTNGSGVTSWAAPSAGATWEKESFTLNGTDISNGYIDLANVANTDSIQFVISGLVSTEGVDYTVNYTGGAGGNTRITFSAHTPTLAIGDIVYIQYQF